MLQSVEDVKYVDCHYLNSILAKRYLIFKNMSDEIDVDIYVVAV